MNYSSERSHDCAKTICDHDARDGWRFDGNCSSLQNPDVMFPADEILDRIDVLIAKSVCNGCPVKAFCLEYGWHDEFGIWGGYSTPDRIRLRRWLRLPSSGTPPRRLVRTLAHISNGAPLT